MWSSLGAVGPRQDELGARVLVVLQEEGLVVGGLPLVLGHHPREELLEALRVVEGQRLVPPGVLVVDGDLGVQEGLRLQQLLHPLGVEAGGHPEHRGVGAEVDAGAVAPAPAQLLELRGGLALGEGLGELRAVPGHPHRERLGEGVHHRGAHPVEAAGDVVALAPELAARVEGGEDDLHRRLLVLGHHRHRDAAAVILDADPAVVLVQRPR
jgi:hypothetical protein